ncbi:hypothetical protein L484_000447 [Morus notabilis]|uniref:Uncharacterized protein n=1 Tax=Morus notabilis TaxID=981085 RepID=W9T2K9_9ROSA|nr:hypothetical protein L484_000447 [Morus notabilis]
MYSFLSSTESTNGTIFEEDRINTKKVNSLGKPRLFLALVGYEDSKHHRRLKNPNQRDQSQRQARTPQ